METSISAMRAAVVRMDASAHNVANINTEGFKAYRVRQEEDANGGVRAYSYKSDQDVNAISEMVDQKLSLRYMQVNTKVLKVQDEMAGSILNIMA